MSQLSRSSSPSSNQLLRRLIEDPAIAEVVRSLEPESLSRLIVHVGLEDAGEIIACASTEQLLGVFDTDLWRREQGGKDAEFQPERFLLWLEILSEAGEKALVSRLADLPEDLVISSFYQHMLVLNLDDLGELEQSWSKEEIDLTDKALADCLGLELDEYYLIARKGDGWDTIIHAVLALYEHEPDLLNRILSRCCYASSEYIEDNGGLFDVLTAEEMLSIDAAADRDDRRAQRGYVAPSDARALFKLAVMTEPKEILSALESDPITRAYFRNFSKKTPNSRTGPAAALRTESHQPLKENSKPGDSRLSALFKSAGILDDAPALPLLSSASMDASMKTGKYQAALSTLLESDPEGHERRVEELIYLANVIEAGFGTSDTPIRPVEAMRAAFDVLDVGLATLEKTMGPAFAVNSKLQNISPVSLFLTGYRIISQGKTIDSMARLKAAAKGPLLL
jgi:hypothetical protein